MTKHTKKASPNRRGAQVTVAQVQAAAAAQLAASAQVPAMHSFMNVAPSASTAPLTQTANRKRPNSLATKTTPKGVAFSSSVSPSGALLPAASNRMIPLKTRKHKPRAATTPITGNFKRLRSNPEREATRRQITDERFEKRRQKIAKAATAPLQARPKIATVNDYMNYPQGSYGNGRYLYLNRGLQGLGDAPKRSGLLDLTHASVEVDHSPHDASQRTGLRVDDEASRYRVAVPLPYAWHRRHKTTHGANAVRYDGPFSQQQVGLVHGGNYATALQNHLSDTFDPATVGHTGAPKINQVAQHTMHALNYAASNNIAYSIHPLHTAGQPAISATEHAQIKLHMHGRFEALRQAKQLANLHNPFT